MNKGRVIRCLLTCLGCGYTFERTKARITKGTDKYCSLSCMAKIEHANRLQKYNNIKAIKIIDGKIDCRICGTKKDSIEFPKSNYKHAGRDNRCLSCTNDRSIAYYKRNIDIVKAKRQTQSHKERHRVYLRKWSKNKRGKDIGYKIKKNLRSRIYKVLKFNKKQDRFVNLIGCSVQELKMHLEKQFKQGMDWGNYGQPGWEIDHIIPCSKFNLALKEQQLECFSYKNLQPLWGYENNQKSDKI